MLENEFHKLKKGNQNDDQSDQKRDQEAGQ